MSLDKLMYTTGLKINSRELAFYTTEKYDNLLTTLKTSKVVFGTEKYDTKNKYTPTYLAGQGLIGSSQPDMEFMFWSP